ncbi:MAG TPA: AmmeMemoRadiSam system radical SAM enzyme [Syntrophomonadaceae bacterium]|nr:AmmeMemoRadiSam system radical SAM enzyme [Syntrophomonadaceae bacterium]
MPAQKALFYETLEEGRVRCLLCPHRCKLRDGQTGICRVRINQGGELYTLNYGEVVSIALDPIEKKPLYHFCPGRRILSAGTWGCNLKCGFCQNHEIAQGNPPTAQVAVEELAELTLRNVQNNSVGLAFTYNEPSIWYEYIRDVASSLKEMGLKVVLVTNGFIENKPLRDILPLIDAMNIDVKSFREEFYRRRCKGGLHQVLQNVETAAASTHVEITTLLIPGENDSEQEMRELAAWLSTLNKKIPLHLSRYHPAHCFTLPSTDPFILERSREIARQYLDFVYLGNLPGEENITACQSCGQVLIRRNAYRVFIEAWEPGRCQACGNSVDYIKY